MAFEPVHVCVSTRPRVVLRSVKMRRNETCLEGLRLEVRAVELHGAGRGVRDERKKEKGAHVVVARGACEKGQKVLLSTSRYRMLVWASKRFPPFLTRLKR